MPSSDGSEVTTLLIQWREGNQDAFEQLLPIVYSELRRLAESYMRRENSGHTMQATELVHEACMRLLGPAKVAFENRSHFFAIAARMMRQVLVQHARAKGAVKRGGGAIKQELNDQQIEISEGSNATVIALDEALQKLAEIDERKSRIIEMRYFGGLTSEEIGVVLDISPATIRRDLKVAHAWLHREVAR